MTFRYFFWILFIVLVIHSSINCTDDTHHLYDGGNGTEENPFRISTIDQLQAIDDPGYLDKHFIQVSDIDASPSAEFQNGSGFKHIGDRDTPFTGSYDGNGFAIRDIQIHFDRETNINGLFGYIKNARLDNIAIVSNLQLAKNKLPEHSVFMSDPTQMELTQMKNIDLSDAGGISGLVGVNEGGVIRNCSYIGHVDGHINQAPSGLVGGNTGIIENSFFKGSVAGGGGIGLVGWNTGKIIESYASGIFSGMTAYGLVGLNYGEIIRSYADIQVSASHFSAGLVGINEGGIYESYSIGIVRGYQKSAGLVTFNNGDIRNSYSLATVELSFSTGFDDMEAAGLVIENQLNGVIEHSYASGEITVSGGEGIIGAIAVLNEGTITASYWDTEATGQASGVGEGNPEGATGLSTQQMSGPAAEANMPEFDWNTVWRTTESYPVLRWQEYE